MLEAKESLVSKSRAYIVERQAAVRAEHQSILEDLKERVGTDISGDTYAKSIKLRLEQSQAKIATFCNSVPESQISKTIRYNPMNWIHASSIDMLGDDETVACKIAAGSWVPAGYDQSAVLPTLGSSVFWGTTHVSTFSNVLLHMDDNFSTRMYASHTQSAIFHVTPLAADLSQYLEDYRYLYANGNNYGFGFVHTGFIYDGTRHDLPFCDNPKNANNFAPADCSTFVGKMVGITEEFRTEDMLFCYRHKTGKGYVRKGWLETPRAKELCGSLNLVKNHDVQPGDLHVLFDFEKRESPTAKRVHYHGHTTIVDTVQDNDVLTIGDGQTVPHRDGFGLETYSRKAREIFEDRITETIFLRAAI